MSAYRRRMKGRTIDEANDRKDAADERENSDYMRNKNHLFSTNFLKIVDLRTAYNPVEVTFQHRLLLVSTFA